MSDEIPACVPHAYIPTWFLVGVTEIRSILISGYWMSVGEGHLRLMGRPWKA